MEPNTFKNQRVIQFQVVILRLVSRQAKACGVRRFTTSFQTGLQAPMGMSCKLSISFLTIVL